MISLRRRLTGADVAPSEQEASAGAGVQVPAYAAPFAGGTGRVGVLLSHGFTGTVASVRPWAEALVAAGYRVRVPRLPGHGTTWQEMNITSWEDWYAAVDRGLAQLRRECDAVFAGGLSMGGALALRLAQQHEDVRGVMLVNPAIASTDLRLYALPVLRRLRASVGAIGDDIALPDVTEHAYPRTPLHAFASMLELQAEVRAHLDRVVCPVLLCVSDVDHVVDPASRMLLRKRLASNLVEVALPHSYHVATLDQDAATIVAESLRFLDAHAALRAGDRA